MLQKCPECGAKLVPIGYGFPGPEMWEKYERREIWLGVCIERIYAYHCFSCDNSFPEFDNEEEYKEFKRFIMRLDEFMESAEKRIFISSLRKKADIGKALEMMDQGGDKSKVCDLLWKTFAG